MYIRKYDRTKYLTLFASDGKYELVFNRIRYVIILKNNISDVYSHKHIQFKINSDDALPLKTLNIYNSVIVIRSVVSSVSRKMIM